MAWVAPVFSQYDLGEEYTSWLYGDPQSNPASYNDPDRWPSAGVVLFQSRALTADLKPGSVPFDPGNNTYTFNLDLAGGRNAVVFGRYANVSLTTGGIIAQQLPNQLSAYVWVRQTRLDGYQEIQDTVLPTVFGSGYWPNRFPAPIMWNDKLRRNLTVSNVTRDPVTVTLVWELAYLNTGA